MLGQQVDACLSTKLQDSFPTKWLQYFILLQQSTEALVSKYIKALLLVNYLILATVVGV